MTIFQALRDVNTAEDFIYVVADLGDPETGDCDTWDDTDMRCTMEAIIERARLFQGEICRSRCILIQGLAEAEEGLRKPDKRASALEAVRHALRNG